MSDAKGVSYDIVSDYLPGRFVEKMAAFIRAGWEPFGGVSTTHNAANEMIFTQAIVLRATNDNTGGTSDA